MTEQNPSPALPSAPAAFQPARPWNPLTRFSFRFLFAYLLLYNFQSFVSNVCSLIGAAIGLFTKAEWVGYVYAPAQWVQTAQQTSVVWLVKTLFNIDITNFPNGSGDTQYNYYELAVYAAAALLAAILWTIIAFSKPAWRGQSHTRLMDYLRIYVRYVLAFTMITYGMIKVIKLQFPEPSFYRLTEAYGDSSPMGILWAMMGVSWPYNVFAGLGETIGGLLLFWRRTSLLGSVISAGVMANVVALNFCYDVPVKLYSSHLFLQALWLAAPNLSRVITLLLTDRAVPPKPADRLVTSRRVEIAWVILKTLLVAAYMTNQTISGIQSYYSYGDGAPLTPLVGMYAVQHCDRGEPLTSPAPDRESWKEIIIGRTSAFMGGLGSVRIESADRSRISLQYHLDPAAKTITFITPARPPAPGNQPSSAPSPAPADLPTPLEDTLTYTEPDPDHVELRGTFQSRPLTLLLKRKSSQDYLLLSRGFHWINNFPFNR